MILGIQELTDIKDQEFSVSEDRLSPIPTHAISLSLTISPPHSPAIIQSSKLENEEKSAMHMTVSYRPAAIFFHNLGMPVGHCHYGYP